MSLNLNKVILAGRLTAKPELKATPNGVSVTSFSVATDRRTAKDTPKKTDFISCVAWRTTAEFITKYFDKGSAVCLVGNIQTRSWKDQNGNTRYATEVIADEAYFVEKKAENVGQTGNLLPNAPAPHFEELNPDEDIPF